MKMRRRPTLPHVTAVPSARPGLTSLFGMGRGGPRSYSHHKTFDVSFSIHPNFFGSFLTTFGRLQHDVLRVKPSLRTQRVHSIRKATGN
jgi:hypothetical protein